MRHAAKFLGLAVLTMGMFVLSQRADAARLLTVDEALKQMFPDVDQVITETVTLTAPEVAKVKARLGGQLVHYQAGSESEKVNETTTYTFYVGLKGTARIRMAVVDTQPGKWGPVEYIIAIGTAPGKIDNLAVMSYQEKRGRPIARNNFLKQFTAKGSSDPICVNKDIRAISGATISSDATCFAVKKALALFDNVYMTRIKAASSK
jgi:Na+-translocating ferredoxin:NAD+ oxidoreductase RnfG subunit